MKSLGLLGLVFDTGFSVTPLMGHLGCLASRWSVPVACKPQMADKCQMGKLSGSDINLGSQLIFKIFVLLLRP